MALTSAQLATLKAAILADNTLNAFPNTDNGNGDLANALNAIASPDWLVWQTAVPVDAINDAITWANFTPQDTPDNTVTWSNRSLACQGKQFNLQTMLVGRSTLDASKSNLRAGLQDALTAIPSGASGASKNGGWANVQAILSRKAKLIEKILSTGTGSQATPATMGYEGTVTGDDVTRARNT